MGKTTTGVACEQTIISTSRGGVNVHIEVDEDRGFGRSYHLGLQCVGWKRDDLEYAGTTMTRAEAVQVARALCKALGIAPPADAPPPPAPREGEGGAA